MQLRASVLFLLLALCVPSTASALSVADLGPMSSSGWAAVNNAGQVAGGVAPEGSGGWGGQAARWEKGTVTRMDRGGTSYAGASAIDGAARLFGLVIYPPEPNAQSSRAAPAIWDAGSLRELPEPNPGENTGFKDASENGNAIGLYHPSNDRTGTFLARPPAYQFTELPADAYPGGVNDAGHVTGTLMSGEPFLWTGGGSMTPIGVAPGGPHSLGQNDEVVGRRYVSGETAGGPAVRRGDGTVQDLPTTEGASGGRTTAVAISFAGVIVGKVEYSEDGRQVRDGVIWRDGNVASLDTLLPAGSGWNVDEALDISSNGQWILARGHKGDADQRHTLLLGLPRPELSVTLRTADIPDSDLVEVAVTVENTGDTPVSELTSPLGVGLRVVPDVFPAEGTGELAVFKDSGEAFPASLEPGASATRTFTFLTVRTGKVLLQAEFKGRNEGTDVRDAEYAELAIDPARAGVLERMAAVEAIATEAHNMVIAASRKWAAKRAQQMRALPRKVQRRWLGSTDGGIDVIRDWDRAVAHMHGISPEELATQVPRGKVIKKGGERKIAQARRAVAKADTKRMEARAEARLARVVRRQTLTSSESMAAYNRARMQTDNNELWHIYDEYVEQNAKSLWQAGGGTWRALLQTASYEGRQQIEADLIRFAELNQESFRDTILTARHPFQAYDETMAVFGENIEEAEVARAKREQFKRNLYVSDPVKAIELQAQDDSRYLGDIMRGFIELFDPTPGPAEILTWAGKQATSKVGRGSVVMAKATQEGDKIAGAKILNGAEDLGEGVRHADDFTFRSADPDEVLKLDQIGRKGGAGMRDQRLAEQINREVTEGLRREFPHLDVEFAMSYRPKKDYDPLGSLAKPQAFGEKTLDPRSIAILGAPWEGLGKLVIFRPKHPLQTTKGWDKLPAIQKQADLELYKLHLDQWTNYNKRNPAGKTAEWKKAIGEKRKIEFGGGHSVELELEAHRLGKDAIEIRAKEMSIDGTLIHKGKPASIGGDLDPLIAVNARGGKKLQGEVERRGLEMWNEKAVKYQKEFGFRSGGHGATAHGDDVTPLQWTKFAKYAAVHLDAAEQLKFEALVVKRAGLPEGTKILPAGIKLDEHLLRTTVSDSYVGPLGQVFD